MNQSILSVRGGELNYRVSGDGPPIVFVCTLSGSWAYQLKELAQSYTVVSYDMRGFGTSKSSGGYPSLAEHAEDLAQLIKHLNMKPLIVGLSHGGMVTQMFGRDYSAMAEGLVLVATLQMATGQTRLLLTLLTQFLLDGRGDEFWNVLKYFLFSDAKFDEMIRRQAALRRLMFNQFTVACLENIYSDALKFDSSGWAAEISAKTLVVGGKTDLLFPMSMTSMLAESIPNAAVKAMDCAHLPPVECPQEFNLLVDEFYRHLLHDSLASRTLHGAAREGAGR